MKAMLLKPLEGLEVGQTYEILVSDTTVWLDDNSYSPMHDLKSPIKEYELFEELFDDWFVFQELPEQLKTQIRQVIDENAGATVYMPDADEQAEMLDDALNAVCTVLEGETIDD